MQIANESHLMFSAPPAVAAWNVGLRTERTHDAEQEGVLGLRNLSHLPW